MRGWMLVVFCFSFSLGLIAMKKAAPEDEQELKGHHDVDYDLDLVLDGLGFRGDKNVYSNIQMPGLDSCTALERAVMLGDVAATKEIVQHPHLALNSERRCRFIHKAMLNAAVFAGDINQVRLLSKSPVLHLSEREREAVVMRAHFFPVLVYLGFSKKSRVFFDINASDKSTGDCALTRAVLREEFDIVRGLLTFENLNLNCSDRFGTTALIQAIVSRLDDVLKILIIDDRPRLLNGYYLDINCSDCAGLTPLMWAIKVNNELAVGWLCADHRLDPKKTDKQGRSALDWAYKMKNMVAIDNLEALVPKLTLRPRSARLSITMISSSQANNQVIPKTPCYQTPQSPRSLEELVGQSPGLLKFIPSLSTPNLPLQYEYSYSSSHKIDHSHRDTL